MKKGKSRKKARATQRVAVAKAGAKKKTAGAKKASEATTTKLPKKKAGGEKKPKRLSAIDAAAQVLQKAGKPMRSQEMITAMAEQGLWKSPGGKTPNATLYAAIIREIAANGGKARFKKTDRGQFTFNG